ncbi:MAG: hypothetical protein U0271_20245 [Polyangiaceae bacterium]
MERTLPLHLVARSADDFRLYKSGDSAFVVSREVFLELRAEGVKVDRRFNNLVDWCKVGSPNTIAARAQELWVSAADGVEERLYSLEGGKWKTQWTPPKFWSAGTIVPFPPDRWLFQSYTSGCRETMIDDTFRTRRCEDGPRRAETRLLIFDPNERAGRSRFELPAPCVNGELAAVPACPKQASGSIYAALDCGLSTYFAVLRYPDSESTFLKIPHSGIFGAVLDAVSGTDVVVGPLYERGAQQIARYDGQDISIIPPPFSLPVNSISGDPEGGRWMVAYDVHQGEVWYMSPDAQFERVVLPTGFNPMRLWARDEGDIWIAGVEGTTNVLYRSGGDETTVMEIQSKCPPYPWATP